MMRLFATLVFLLGSLGSFGQETALSKIDALINEANYPQALQLIESEIGKVDHAQLAFLQNKKAEIQILQGNLTNAEATLGQIKNSNAFAEAVTLSNIGFLQLNKGRYDLALEALQTSWTKFQSLEKQNTKDAAKCLANLALVYNTTGKSNQALEYGTIALQSRQKLFGETSEEVAASYNDLGLIYTLKKDLDQALEQYEKALAIYEKLHGTNHPKIAIAAINIGINYQELKLYGDAINNFETAKKIWEKIYPNGHPNQAIVLRNLAVAYSYLNDEKSATAFFNQSLDMYKKSYGDKHPDIAGTYNQLGRYQLSKKKYDETLQSYQSALKANSFSFAEMDYHKNPIGTEAYNKQVMVYTLQLKARALEERHFAKTLKLEDLKIALNSLYTCDSLIDDIRQHSTDESDKLSLGALANEVYEDGVRIAYTISDLTLGSKEYLEQAFYFAEKSKSAVLQESIADTQAKSFAGIPDELLEEEKELKSSIALLAQKLAQKPVEEEEKKLRQQLFTANNNYNQFVKNLETNFPNYYNLKYSKTKTTVADLQKALKPSTALVSYFIAESNKRLYQFIVTNKKFKVINLSLPADFDRYLKGFTNSLFYSNLSIYKKSTDVLARVLLPKITNDISEMVIIPSGSLATIPFEALPTKKIVGEEFKNVSYLINRVGISYDFSASLFLQKSKLPASNAAPSIFLCAPVTFDVNQNLNALPGTEKEVTDIANLFAGKSKAVKFADANESLIKSKELGSYNYLHFATHGVVDEENPASSRIFLSSNTTDDGNLYAGEIYNLNLNANLAVLSACQTGLGKISKGEGVIGLSRALIYAGAKNIVVSFWTVADESTAELMTNFYRELASNPNQDFKKALQKAKLKMIAEGKFANPYYWAPFVLIGR